MPYVFFRLNPCIFCNELTRLGPGLGEVLRAKNASSQVGMTGDDGPRAVKLVGSACQGQTKDKKRAFHTLFTSGTGRSEDEILSEDCRGRFPRFENR